VRRERLLGRRLVTGDVGGRESELASREAPVSKCIGDQSGPLGSEDSVGE